MKENHVRKLAVACVFLACAHRSDLAPAKKTSGKAVLVVLDGFGLAAPGDGNAVAQALQKRPLGFLARALTQHEYPSIELDTAGACVGLPPGSPGNSEAGHSNMCAGEIVVQPRTAIDALHDSGALLDTPKLVEAVRAARDAHRPLHVLVYLADASSLGYFEHAYDLLHLAKREGLRDVQLHLVCDGRGERSCADMALAVRKVAHDDGVGTIASIAGREYCVSRTGPSPKVRACVEGLTKVRQGHEPELEAVLAGLTDHAKEQALAPTPLAHSLALAADDTLVVLWHRRDLAQGVVRIVRHRPSSLDPPMSIGPHVITYGQLDSASHYEDDAHLANAFSWPNHAGFLAHELAGAGATQMRIAEEQKAAHVTYLCDGDDIPDSAQYARVHPKSLPNKEFTTSPCLSSQASVDAAHTAFKNGTDFVLVNLPNADLLGHAGDVAAASLAIQCMDGLLDTLIGDATARGYSVFVTADHGNAEQMLAGGKATETHTANPVPFIAIAPRGAPAWHLRESVPLACPYHVSHTVLDAMGVTHGDPESLLAR